MKDRLNVQYTNVYLQEGKTIRDTYRGYIDGYVAIDNDAYAIVIIGDKVKKVPTTMLTIVKDEYDD